MGRIEKEIFKEADVMCMKGYGMFWRQQIQSSMLLEGGTIA